eukprot:gene25105-46062_t
MPLPWGGQPAESQHGRQVPAAYPNRIENKKRVTAMGENIAPSPHKARGRKNRKSPRRKKAAPRAANGQPASANVAARSAKRPSQNARAAADAGNSAHPEMAGAAQANDSAFSRRNWFERTAYAALDLGTNNCRLLI